MFRRSLIALGIGVALVATACSSDDTDGTATPIATETATVVATAAPAETASATAPAPASHLDASYEIEGQVVTLVGGLAEVEAAPGSASKVTTRVFGNEAMGDLNGDGKEDIAFLLTQDGGGSGTFFYVVVALKTDDGYTGTNAVLLGDRVAPQTTEIRGSELIVNFAERAPGEPMTTPPSIGVSKYLKVVDGELVETTPGA
ncbi:MAG: hypothetical protein CVU47_08065 [Chloroflexi bacterium HGW-Chloroflexi-9]|nr:MAG: hypothetical protein CVU47_08065 [Chloroflexi bacterium HGW-Chloroflexi-9]